MGTEWVPFSLLLIMAFSVRQTLSLPLAMLFCALLAGGQGILWALARKRAAELAPKPKPEPKPEPAPSPDEPASMKASRTSLAELECKLPGLPAETQASVRAIMLDVESPGGTVDGIEELAPWVVLLRWHARSRSAVSARSSVWVKQGAGWRLRYEQITPTVR